MRSDERAGAASATFFASDSMLSISREWNADPIPIRPASQEADTSFLPTMGAGGRSPGPFAFSKGDSLWIAITSPLYTRPKPLVYRLVSQFGVLSRHPWRILQAVTFCSFSGMPARSMSVERPWVYSESGGLTLSVEVSHSSECTTFARFVHTLSKKSAWNHRERAGPIRCMATKWHHFP